MQQAFESCCLFLIVAVFILLGNLLVFWLSATQAFIKEFHIIQSMKDKGPIVNLLTNMTNCPEDYTLLNDVLEICVQRNKDFYYSNFFGCRWGYRMCNQDLCVTESEPCPITFLHFTSHGQIEIERNFNELPILDLLSARNVSDYYLTLLEKHSVKVG